LPLPPFAEVTVMIRPSGPDPGSVGSVALGFAADRRSRTSWANCSMAASILAVFWK
jgi:hypothetical protein